MCIKFQYTPDQLRGICRVDVKHIKLGGLLHMEIVKLRRLLEVTLIESSQAQTSCTSLVGP